MLAENIRKYRKQAGLSQEQLAEKTGLHRAYVGGIEQCRINVSVKNVEKIAQALGIDPALLFLAENTSNSHYGSDGENPCYTLCRISGDSVSMQPISVYDEDLSVSILCALISDGHKDDLAEAYARSQHVILDFVRKNRIGRLNGLGE